MRSAAAIPGDTQAVSSRVLEGVGICMLGSFNLQRQRMQLQAETLAQYLEGEGARVIRSSYRAGAFARALDMAWTLIRRRNDYDVIQIQSHSYRNFLYTLIALAASKLFSKTVICMYYGGAAHQFLPRYGGAPLKLLKRMDVLVVASDFLGEFFASYGMAAVVLPHAVDVSSWTYRERTALQPNLLWVRAFESEYNPYMFVEVFRLVKARLPMARLTVIGTGSLLKQTRALVERYGLDGIEFHGRVERSELARIFGEADVFLSTSNVDNQPLTILEAFACGLPVVTTRAGGIPLIVRDRDTGMLVDVGDAQGMADKVIELLETPALAHHLSVTSHAESNRYSWQQLRNGWLRIYKSVLPAH